jgi:hypothetical protein
MKPEQKARYKTEDGADVLCEIKLPYLAKRFCLALKTIIGVMDRAPSVEPCPAKVEERKKQKCTASTSRRVAHENSQCSYHPLATIAWCTTVLV